MKKDLNKKIDKILESTAGMHRAKPSDDLLTKIENQIDSQEATIIPISRLRWAAAAAILLLLVNGLAINIYLNQKNTPTNYAKQSIITEYKLY